VKGCNLLLCHAGSPIIIMRLNVDFDIIFMRSLSPLEKNHFPESVFSPDSLISAASAACFWERDISNMSKKVFLGIFGDYFLLLNSFKKKANFEKVTLVARWKEHSREFLAIFLFALLHPYKKRYLSTQEFTCSLSTVSSQRRVTRSDCPFKQSNEVIWVLGHCWVDTPHIHIFWGDWWNLEIFNILSLRTGCACGIREYWVLSRS